MSWLWIILRYLFPGDPIRQVAEGLRHRALQLVHVSQDEATLAELLINPALRLHLEQLILDAEDSLRLWIAMRACQIARIRPGLPHGRATPRLTRAKSLPELVGRIAELVIACTEMEARAQAHADKLKRLRDADPLAAHGSPDTANGAALRAAAHHEAVGVSSFQSGLMVSSKAMPGMALRPSNHEAVLTALAAALTRGPPHSIEGANP